MNEHTVPPTQGLWDFTRLKARILNAVDRDPLSRTAGCCDRAYWGWKSRDFPDLTLQYAAYPFSLLMDPASPTEREVLRSMARFWIRGLTCYGSADQMFPGERSAGPTLYVLHGMLSASGHILDVLDGDEGQAFLAAARRSLDFALREPEDYGFVANHKALFAHAFLLGGRVLGDERYKRAATREVDALAAHFREGWFPEYGTADPGYQTQCLHYLTLFHRDQPDPLLKRMIVSGLEDFCVWFAFPDGSYAGSFGGRATAILYPCALLALAPESPACAEAACALFADAENPALVAWPDLDLPNMLRLGTNYLLAREHLPLAPPAARPALPCAGPAARSWPGAKLAVAADERANLAVNLARGGIFKVVDRQSRTAVEDTGYLIMENGRKHSSSLHRDTCVQERPDGWVVEAAFTEFREDALDPARLVALRLLGATLLRWGRFATWLKRRMVRTLILHREPSPLTFRREMSYREGVLEILDTITASREAEYECHLTGSMVPFHMACAKYWENVRAAPGYPCGPLRFRTRLTVHTTVTFCQDNVRIARETT